MRVGIALNDWKAKVFKKRLTEAGFAYTEEPGLAEGLLTLGVVTDEVEKLAEVVAAANAECARSRMH